MRISSIYIKDFLGIDAVDVQLRAPVALFCGANGAGKSSVRDAVALALTADLGRVSLKKEAPALIRDGAEMAVCQVVDADGDQWQVAINAAGKITDSQKGRDTNPVLPYVLDAQRFARLSPTERRAFLFGLMGVKTDQGDIARRLEARGCHIGNVHRVLPLLRSGFDAACAEAKAKATEAKGAWRTVTGETYGSEKAKTWKAPMPVFDAARQKELQTNVMTADHALEQWQQLVGKLQAEAQHRDGLRAKLPGLQEIAEKIGRITAKLETDRQQLAEWEADLQKTRQEAGAAPRVGLVHDMAEHLAAMLMHGERCNWFADGGDAAVVAEANQLLARYEAEHGAVGAVAGDEKARARLPNVQKSRDLMASAVANGERDLLAAQNAQGEAARISAELAQPFDAKELEQAQQHIVDIKAGRAKAVTELDALKSIKAAADSAERKTKEAGEHAETVAAWDLIAQALSPDGIPAEILAEALGPINARLAQSAADADWDPVVIGADMEIRVGSRDRVYALLSESERWRCDAMLAEAIAQVSGARLLVLDRGVRLVEHEHRGRLRLVRGRVLGRGRSAQVALIDRGTLDAVAAEPLDRPVHADDSAEPTGSRELLPVEGHARADAHHHAHQCSACDGARLCSRRAAAITSSGRPATMMREPGAAKSTSCVITVTVAATSWPRVSLSARSSITSR